MAEPADVWLSEAELAFLRSLNERGVRFVVVGMSAAILLGVPGTTQDIDLWFESVDDERIGQAALAVGGFWATRMSPPMLGGPLGERFDVVTHMSGLESFEAEYPGTRSELVSGVPLRILSLDRIVVSKRASGRPKDALAVRLIEETIAVLDHEGTKHS